MIYWIWLSKIPGIGIHSRRQLLDYFKKPEAIYETDFSELLKVKNIGERKAQLIMEARSLESSKRILFDCECKGIKIMTLKDDIYPNEVKGIPDMPTHLYYKGNPIKDSMGTAVVGPRRCSFKGKETAVRYASSLAQESIPVISGMAKGIDSYAHTACIKAGGYTVAVLGNGLDICYPSEHKLLMQRIEENGLLVSEYEPGVRPNRNIFPQRNRIIAAWSKEIVVVEAKERSGALITAEYGLHYGRKVTMVSEK